MHTNTCALTLSAGVHISYWMGLPDGITSHPFTWYCSGKMDFQLELLLLSLVSCLITVTLLAFIFLFTIIAIWGTVAFVGLTYAISPCNLVTKMPLIGSYYLDEKIGNSLLIDE
jgi:hypothetical protein